jgi:hypothetical protein
MPRRTAIDRKKATEPGVGVAHRVLEPRDESLLDLLDRLLDKGVMANGDLTLGVAGIDLIYVRVAALLCAADRLFPRDPSTPRQRTRHRSPGPRRFQ